MNTNALILLISAAVSALSAYFAWKRRHNAPAALPLAVLMVSMTAWSLPYALYWLSTTSAARMFWVDASYVGVVGVPGAFLAVTLCYTNHEHWLTRRRIALLTIEPILCCLLLWTDQYHGLFTAGKRIADATAVKDGGIGYWGNFFYSYTLVAVSFFLLIHFVFTVQKPYRSQARTVLLSASIPFVANVISIYGDTLHGLDPTAPAFTISGLIMGYSLFSQKLLDLVPIARGKVIEIMQDSMIVIDAQQRIVDVNPAADRLLTSLGSGSIIGQPVCQFFDAWGACIDSKVRANEQFEVEITVEGTPRTYEIGLSPLSDKRGRLQGAVLILHDITERKRIEETQRHNLEYRQAVFDSVNDAIFIYDGALSQIVDANARMVELCGFSREEIIGSSGTSKFNAGLAPYDSEHAAQKVILARTEGPQTFEWQGKHKTNGVFWLEVCVRRALLGGTEHFIVSANDISMRKATQERALELARERERIDLLKRFITDASHDFRTPLSTISTSSYLLTKTSSEERRARHLGVIQEQIQHIIGLLDSFLRVAHLDAENKGLAIRPLDANAAIGTLVSLQMAQAAHKQQHFSFLPDPDLPLIAADQKALEQIVSHLLTNAISYTPQGGTITVSTHRAKAYAVIEVSDTGIGIQAFDLPRIFDHFFRADPSRSTLSGGAGLGLPIAKRLIETMRGSIEAESTPDVGSTFRVRLPLAHAMLRDTQEQLLTATSG